MNRVRVVFLALVALAATVGGVPPVGAQPSGDEQSQRQAAAAVEAQLDAAEADGKQLAPDQIDRLDDLGPNPWLSYTVDRSPEAVKAWQRVAAQLPDKVQIPNGKAQIGGPPLVYDEQEPAGEVGSNDTAETGELISRFGTAPGEKGVVTINGSLSGGLVRNPIQGDCESNEDDGSISQANPTPAAEIEVALCVGEIGDGPYGETSGDIDFYSFGQIEEGQLLILDTWHISDSIDPVRSIIGIYDADGNLLASLEDGGLPGDDPWITLIAPADGEYFGAIAGCCELSSDPFDSASGPGVGATGTYELFVVAFPPPCTSTEDDGSIGLANDTYVPDYGYDACTGVIGDGPHGPADSDFYALGTIPADNLIYADVVAWENPVNTVIGLYDSAGNLVASTTDSSNPEQPEYLEVAAPATDEYFVAVSGCCDLPADPNDPASGTPSDESGLYEVYLDTYEPPCTSTEDDGAIGLANDTNVPDYQFDFCFGTLGDGPHGPADTDWYRMGPAVEGGLLYVDSFGPEVPGPTTAVGLYDQDGTLVDSATETDLEFTEFEIPADGEYYVALAGCCELQADPTDPASGVASDEAGDYLAVFELLPPPCESTEDDGAIGLANEATGSGDDFIFVSYCSGEVGDGPQAEVNGDVDFFRTRPLAAGRLLIVDFDDAGGSAGAADLTIGIYNEAGELIATGQDDPGQAGPGSDFFSVLVPADGVYYVAVGGAMPTDPTDPATGTNTDIVSPYTGMYIVDTTEEFVGSGATGWTSGGGFDSPAIDPSMAPAERLAQRRSEADRSASSMAGRPDPSEGALARLSEARDQRKAEANASMEAAAAAADEAPTLDVDYYLVELEAGDAISGGFDRARDVGIFDPQGVLRHQSPFNPSFIYPLDSPLRHDRRIGFDHVATTDGVYAVYVTDGPGEYQGELRVVRSGLADEKTRGEQILYLDFDGATVSGDTWGTGFDAELSPLSSYLGGWGLGPDDEDAVIDAVIDAVVETVDEDLRVRDGRNGDRDASDRPTEFDVTVLNSRDHGEQWGNANVTRLVVGGSTFELGIDTLGIAQSIDPGNTDTTETGVILLDLMSSPAGPSYSINSYEVAPGTSKADFVGFTVGHIAAHEAGHVLGNWHQETFNEVLALMDAGGDFPAIAGVGPDGVFGTGDDTDPDFVEDIFNTWEGFSGAEDTAGRTVFGLSTGQKTVPGPRN